MLVEAEAIPYEPAPLRGERLLVLAPHPDDEVIGCGGLLALHLRDGRSARVVIATDGSKATGASANDAGYRARREEESRRGLAALGGAATVRFLGFPDRGLDDSVSAPLRDELLTFRPDIVCVPSPVEIHPDHIALSKAFCELVQRDEVLFAELATTRVAFYEVSQPLRPNTLVDITDVADLKYAAIAAHESQIILKDYVAYARGLNAYRAMTLPPETKAAEGYWVTPLPTLQTRPFSELRRLAGHIAAIEVVRPQLAVSVVVRTKNRPILVRDAIASIRANEYPAEIVVVNDGGTRPEAEGVKVVEHETSRGRSEAMNSGVRAATGSHVAFLDDDDLFYPEHLPSLVKAANSIGGKVAWYTDAVSAFMRVGPTGAYECRARQRLFATDFDRDLLFVDNYIPLTTLLVPRDLFLESGGFDPGFDLFEDWDFLIRLAERGDFARIPRITCEVRHFEGGDSIIAAAPEGSGKFRDAKLQVWTKHSNKLTNEVIANAWEKQKRRVTDTTAQLVEEKGRISHADENIVRLEREKNELIRQIGALHETTNAKLMYIQQLEGTIAELRPQAAQTAALGRENGELRGALEATTAALGATRAETERLQGLLDMIFRSRPWKLHTLVDRLRGRG
jgi:LmbE family N-acetylglucosaminyl deacetylase/glycosyltransferase involved in cell wall biosynthesis